MRATWSVAVFYEDDLVKQEAMDFCGSLMNGFWATSSFDIAGWSFSKLEEPASAKRAAARAAVADLLVFAIKPEGEVPLPVRAWIETWLTQRADREGALVGLRDPGDTLDPEIPSKFTYLRSVAHRAGLDYLTQVPVSLSRPVPDSIDSFTKRADQVTGVLDDILHHPPPPPQLPA